MQQPELTLDAALRDADAKRDEARHKAIRSLAAAYLLEAGLRSPHFRAADEDERGPAVREALLRTLQQDDPSLSSMAAVGLGMLGEPDVLDAVSRWVDAEGDDPGDQFRRECAVIAISFLGASAPESGEGPAVRKRVMKRLRGWLSSERPDVRFQAGVALAEVGGDDVAGDLVDALAGETHDEVRDNLIDALSRIDPPPPPVVEAMRDIVADPAELHTSVGFEAAMILASVRDRAAGSLLVEALAHRGYRDRALEALAVLGRAAPAIAVERVHAVATAILTPGVARVRAAYALARIVAPSSGEHINPGVSLLRKLRWHPSSAVREAVDDAHANLKKLDSDT